MNPLIAELIQAGLIDAATAELLQRQLDPNAAKLDAEQQLLTAVLNGLQAQQEAATVGANTLTIDQASALFDANESVLADAILPTVQNIASERAIGQAISVATAFTDAALEASFMRVNENVLGWANTYYVSLQDGDVGSVPNLNATSRRQFLSVFEQWNRGQLENQQDGQNRGLPNLIEALESTFGPSRAEAIATTEVTRIFGEATKAAGRASDIVTGFQWVTAADERVCPICRPLNGMIIPKAEDTWRHPEPERGAVSHPAHVRCRCDLLMVTT